MFLSLIPNMKGSVWDFEWMLLKLLNHIFKDFGRNLLSFDIMTMMMWRYWSVSNRVSVQFLGINMQEIMEIRDLSPPGSQKSCKFNQQISSMKKWKRRKKILSLRDLTWTRGDILLAWQLLPQSGSTNIVVSIFKGILHQKIFYRLNLIFWIVMGCGIARFGRRGLKTTETWKFWSQILSHW